MGLTGQSVWVAYRSVWLCQKPAQYYAGAEMANTFLEKAQRLRVVADQQVLGLLVVGQCQLVRFAADA